MNEYCNNDIKEKVYQTLIIIQENDIFLMQKFLVNYYRHREAHFGSQ